MGADLDQAAGKKVGGGPSLDALKARARDLVPILRERALATEQLRRIPDQTLADLHKSGIFRMHQPKRLGGSEAPYRALVDLGSILAQGCASTAWVTINLASHHWMLGMWPQAAQDEIWGQSPDVLIGSAFAFPAGRAKAAPGGWRLKGRWGFSSGIDPCAWNFVGGLVEDDAGKPGEPRMFLVPKADYQILDTWHVAGLAGTGSKDVVIEDCFVPAHRALAAEQISGGPTPGSAVNASALYRLPTFILFPCMIAAVGIGIAQGAVAEFADTTKKRASSYTGARLASLATLQLRLAEAAALTDAAEKIVLSDCDEAQDLAEANLAATIEQRARWRRDGAFAGKLCAQAVELLFTGAGGNTIYLTHPLQRSLRDVHAANGHFALNWDAAATMYGRVALGLPHDLPVL
jgi:3-hydroxy-9,10-secoandrosta-1,3,5(10)-triene-9,17-dione monooxygenase